MGQILRWLLCRCGRRGRFWDMLGQKVDGEKAIELSPVFVGNTTIRVRVRIIKPDNPSVVYHEFGTFCLELDSEQTRSLVINLDANTVRIPPNE